MLYDCICYTAHTVCVYIYDDVPGYLITNAKHADDDVPGTKSD